MIRKKVGRPKKNDKNVKSSIISVRLDEKDLIKLTNLRLEDGKKNSDILRDALDLYYKMRNFDEFS